jgi:hypothetical protein
VVITEVIGIMLSRVVRLIASANGNNSPNRFKAIIHMIIKHTGDQNGTMQCFNGCYNGQQAVTYNDSYLPRILVG